VKYIFISQRNLVAKNNVDDVTKNCVSSIQIITSVWLLPLIPISSSASATTGYGYNNSILPFGLLFYV
jgi:hypothetical protein